MRGDFFGHGVFIYKQISCLNPQGGGKARQKSLIYITYARSICETYATDMPTRSANCS